MGKKGGWFSAIKRVFTHSSKEKATDGSDKKSSKQKKKGKGILKRGETKSLIPLFRGPSSIEQILGEADQLLIRAPSSSEQPKSPPALLGKQTSPRVASPIAASSPKAAASPKAVSCRASSPKAAASPKSASCRASSPKATTSPKAASYRASSPKAVSPRASSPRAVSPTNALPESAPLKAASSTAAAPSKASTAGDASSTAAAPSKASTAGAASSTAAAPSKASTAGAASSTAAAHSKACTTRAAASTSAAPPKASTAVAAEPPKASTAGAASSKAAPPPKASTAGAASSKAAASKVKKSGKEISYVQRPEPTLGNQHLSATKIQAVYRGYKARKSFRALKGLARLQGVVKGPNVKRQMMNAMKQMQLLVRVQTQIQSRRIQMLENNAQAYRNDKEAESTLSKYTQMSEAGQNEDWDDSRLTKEEVEEGWRKKVEAVIKRERAMAYAYSHQLWKANPKSAQTHSDIRSNGYPWWWNWLERQLPPASTSQSQSATRNISLTPSRTPSQYNPSPRSNYRHSNFSFDNHESTPRSSRSAIPIRAKYFQTPPANTPNFIRYSKPRTSAANSAYDKDDDSLVSCPPFSVPNYMVPTASAKAKVRANSNPKERFPRTPDSNRRFSFPLTPNSGSIKWNKGSNVAEKQEESSRSIGELSVGSTVSMPALVGRKPFNRFV